MGQRTRTAQGEAAIVIGRGRRRSSFVRSLERNAGRTSGAAENKDFFRGLWDAADDAARRRIIYNRQSTTALRRGIPGPAAPPLYQALHIAPRELLSNRSLRNFFRRIKFNIENGLHNGVMLLPDGRVEDRPMGKLRRSSGLAPELHCTNGDIDQPDRGALYAGSRAAGGDQARIAAASQRALGELETLLAQTRSNLISGLEVLN